MSRNRAPAEKGAAVSSANFAMPRPHNESRGPLKVFLCHGKEDKAAVRELFHKLRGDGFSPWLDEEDLLPGQHWESEIKKAVRSADAVVVCLSASSASRAGFAQKEIRLALDEADKRPDGTIFVIPVGLQACEVPQQLEGRQWVFLHQSGGYAKLRRALLSISQPATPLGRKHAALGIDVGSTKIEAGLVDFSIKHKPDFYLTRQYRHAQFKKTAGLVERIAAVTRDLIQSDGRSLHEIEWIGIGLPGMVDGDAGKLRLAPGLDVGEIHVVQKLRELLFKDMAPEALTPPILVENDVTCATRAELLFGHGRRHKNFACVLIGTGIGAGIVINGELYRGNSLAAGELGHMRVDRRDKDKTYVCNCGAVGCFEEYAAARGIVRIAEKWIERRAEKLTPEDVVAFIKRDTKGRALAKVIAESIAIGLANLANVLNPQAIVLGGGIIYGFSEYEDFMKLLRSSFAANVLSACDAELLHTQSKQSALLGAAALGLR